MQPNDGVGITASDSVYQQVQLTSHSCGGTEAGVAAHFRQAHELLIPSAGKVKSPQLIFTKFLAALVQAAPSFTLPTEGSADPLRN